jgi:hypothetical protein
MPRFYFDLVLDGATEADSEGLDLPNVIVARAEAARAAAEMVNDRAAGDNVGLTIVVRDEGRSRRTRLNLVHAAPYVGSRHDIGLPSDRQCLFKHPKPMLKPSHLEI